MAQKEDFSPKRIYLHGWKIFFFFQKNPPSIQNNIPITFIKQESAAMRRDVGEVKDSGAKNTVLTGLMKGGLNTAAGGQDAED